MKKMLDQLTIDELLLRCQKKDQRAQMEVYQRYHKAMYHSALRIVQNPVDAEDVMHDGFLTAFEKIKQYKGENKFGGWLKQITLRKALNHIQNKEKNRWTELKEEQLEETFEGEITLTEEQTATLEVALTQLKDRYRTALVLMYLEGYDYDELSEILKLSYGNCRTLISRAKTQLKQTLLHNEISR